MSAHRTSVTRAAGSPTCDLCHAPHAVAFRVEFDDGTYSLRCARHERPMYDRSDALRAPQSV